MPPSQPAFPSFAGRPCNQSYYVSETCWYCEKRSHNSILTFITSSRKCLTSPSAALWSDQRLPPGPMQLCSCPARWRLGDDGCALILQILFSQISIYRIHKEPIRYTPTSYIYSVDSTSLHLRQYKSLICLDSKDISRAPPCRPWQLSPLLGRAGFPEPSWHTSSVSETNVQDQKLFLSHFCQFFGSDSELGLVWLRNFWTRWSSFCFCRSIFDNCIGQCSVTFKTVWGAGIKSVNKKI